MQLVLKHVAGMAAAIMAFAAIGATPASAAMWRGGGGFHGGGMWHGGGGFRGGWRGGYGGWGWGAPFAFGALAGAALAGPYYYGGCNPYYSYGYGCGYYGPYGYGPYGYGPYGY